MKIKNKAIKMSAHSIFEKNELITLYTFFWISGIAALVYLATLP
jgi:hypothetical protein